MPTLTPLQWGLTIGGIALAVFLVIFATIFFSRMYRIAKGTYNRHKVWGFLRGYARLHNFEAMRDVNVEIEGKTASIDFILIGFFGAVLFCVEDFDGEYYCEPKEETWAFLNKSGQKSRIPNAVHKLTADMDVLRTIFSKNNVYRIQMEPLVVFSPSQKHCELYVNDAIPFVRTKGLRKYFGKVKYDKDNNVDVKALAALIRTYQRA